MRYLTEEHLLNERIGYWILLIVVLLVAMLAIMAGLCGK